MDSNPLPLAVLRQALERQYRASLAMLRDAVQRCPDDLWLDATPTNAFWQVAYHTLYFTHLYLQPDEASFRPWPGHQAGVQHVDGIAGEADPDSDRPLVPEPYPRAAVLAYAEHCESNLAGWLAEIDLQSPESGFWWYGRMPKLEHQFVNLRHLQHHTAQLADRLRAATGEGVGWVSSR